MRLLLRFVGPLAALVAMLLLPGRALFAADDLQSVLRQLDLAAARFRSTAADFEFDSIQTEPIPDTDVQKGTADYVRDGKSFKMAAHINEVNGKPVPKVYMYADGALELFEPLVDQVTRFKRAKQFEGYLLLGFGASGKELADKWNITYDGQETIDGIKTDKLELVAKDPAVLKNLPKVTIWLDTARAVSLKQVFDEPDGTTRTCHYTDLKVNQTLPGGAFNFNK